MGLLNQQLQRSLLTEIDFNSTYTNKKKPINLSDRKRTSLNYSAITTDGPCSVAGVAGIKWGLTKLQGAREEMENDAFITHPDSLNGFSFAAVFDGHAGSTSVKFLREELYKECPSVLQGGLLLSGKDFDVIKSAMREAFENVDSRLLNLLQMGEKDDESGATATVMLVGSDQVYIAHTGDSSAVLSRSGKEEVITDAHRPYGSNKASQITRIREQVDGL